MYSLEELQQLLGMFYTVPVFELVVFLAFYGFIDSTAEEGDRKQGERERGSDTQQRTQAGSRTRSAAEPQHMGCPRYQLS